MNKHVLKFLLELQKHIKDWSPFKIAILNLIEQIRTDDPYGVKELTDHNETYLIDNIEYEIKYKEVYKDDTGKLVNRYILESRI